MTDINQVKQDAVIELDALLVDVSLEDESLVTKEFLLNYFAKRVRRLELGIQAAGYLIKGATGPDGGPESWDGARDRWFEQFSDELPSTVIAEQTRA